MTRSTEQVLAEQMVQAAADRKRDLAHRKVLPGLPPLHALQERLWGWHDERARSKDKFGVLQARPTKGNGQTARLFGAENAPPPAP